MWTPQKARNCGEIIKDNLITTPKLKNLFSIYSEMVFNIMLHGAEKEIHEDKEYGIGSFELWADDDYYLFITKNKISQLDADKIIERCNYINSLDRDALVDFYRETRKESAEANRKGGNIGLIDIVRKSKNPLKITSIEFSENNIELEIEAKVNK